MISLGFDASTSCVGWAFTENGKILDCGYIDISDITGNRAKAWFVIEKLKSHPLTDKIGQVNLEGSLSGFGGPANRAVVVLLARWNAIFEYVLEDHFKRPVNLVNVSSARKQVFGKASIAGLKPKEYVKMMIEDRFDMTPWIVLNRNKVPDKKNEDTYDAVVISLFTPPEKK